MKHDVIEMAPGIQRGLAGVDELIIMNTLLLKPGPQLHFYWIRFQELTVLNTCLADVCLESPRPLGKSIVVHVQIPPHCALKIHCLHLCMQRTTCYSRVIANVSKVVILVDNSWSETHSLDAYLLPMGSKHLSGGQVMADPLWSGYALEILDPEQMLT